MVSLVAFLNCYNFQWPKWYQDIVLWPLSNQHTHIVLFVIFGNFAFNFPPIFISGDSNTWKTYPTINLLVLNVSQNALWNVSKHLYTSLNYSPFIPMQKQRNKKVVPDRSKLDNILCFLYLQVTFWFQVGKIQKSLKELNRFKINTYVSPQKYWKEQHSYGQNSKIWLD